MAFENRVLHQEFQVRPPPPPQIEPSQISCFHSRSARARLLLSKKKRSTFFGVRDASDLLPAHLTSSSSAALASRGVSGDALSVHALRGVRFGR
jgi:hypothetical protein